MPRRSVREARHAEIDDAEIALSLRNGLADLLEDTYDRKRKDMVSQFRKGESTFPSLIAYVAQLAMAEELIEALDRRIQKGRRARNEEIINGSEA